MTHGLETMARLNDQACIEYQPAFPIPDASMTRSGMVISLSGVLIRAADALGSSKRSSYLEYPLRELLENLEQVRASKNDKEALDRMKAFFTLYVIQ